MYSSFDPYIEEIKSSSHENNDTISLFIQRAKNRKLNKKQNTLEYISTTLESSKSFKRDTSNITKMGKTISENDFQNEKEIKTTQKGIWTKVIPKFFSKNIESSVRKKNTAKENSKIYSIRPTKVLN